MKIVRLNEELQNLIAAGEVVERPLSVVKELVENAIDAHSTQIVIDLIASGTKMIKVSDNGIGMSQEDALMSIKRHATSKIKEKVDLFSIMSLGFRGEALPSIASVSNFTLITSDGVENTKVNVKGGKLIDTVSYAANKGTSISVENLFFNTPARLNFLKSSQYELAIITDFISKISLAYHNISFKLTNDQKVIVKTSGANDLMKCISENYGVDVAKRMNYLKFGNYDYQVEAYFSSPEITRSNKNSITIIVNNRVVKNYLISNKIVESYKDKLFSKRYPIAILKITCDPLLVDVNVHPSKQELKYTDEQKLLQMIYQNLNDYLFNKSNSDYKFENKNVKTEIVLNDTIKEKINFYQDSKSYVNTKNTGFDSVSYDFMKSISFDEVDVKNETREQDKIVEENDIDEIIVPIEEKKLFPKLDYIGQVFNTYLLFEGSDGLYLIDQHAACERINYELFSKKLADDQDLLSYYELLVPIILTFEPSDFIKIKDSLEEIKKFGLELDVISNNSLALRKVPIWFFKNKESDIAYEIINSFINNKSLNIVDNIAKSLACKASLKANSYINKIEVEKMLEDISKCDNPYNCPHGRPTLIKYTKYELERMFKR